MIIVSKELEKEFTKVIASVTKDITESVVRDSALASVKELNESLKTLKNDSPKLVKDIEKAGNMYTNVSHEAMENMKLFLTLSLNGRVDNQKFWKRFLIEMTSSLLVLSNQKNGVSKI